MFQIIGIVVVFGMVFGGFMLAGGHFDVIIKAAPFEMMMIGGSAVGALLIGNSFKTVLGVLGGFGKAMAGPKWKPKDYTDLLSVLFVLTKTMKTKGVVAIEAHIENPKESRIFQEYPKIMKDHFALDLICDTLRMMTMNMEDPHQVEDAIEKQIEKHHHEAHAPAHALQGMADALPALGIVAAVLGIIKTMGAINQPPEYLGKLIGSALVGTFLGVFLAYGLVGPFASRMGEVIDEEGKFYQIIKDVLVAHLHGNAAQISVEIGRGNIPSTAQPTFAQLEEALNNVPEAA
ncbi:flagellar motor stator protein MotA [Ponticaulis sp.]|uniref:flagellar motor stator protein MotA n=1 Tax=Ponticaulis sp. TaxID=2020902 RepID=UPI000C3B43EE|nr:flagellar motor stator protein MotA [Ponticaulis sp.]HBH88602.1 flagellar motor stator protein MotA [Hyphomonadaceae bacterium]MAJ07280.1 flagellar motor stator protein MotA [Ponticaulis sp.]MAJ10366.1 flagellar motor stator protein MotA [Ponticaulis sp.]MDF1680066.1 flagellar motor stator protein MotA [Ponticaulis sp.]HBJ93024.1 flagellar motor stator protein MotA [Hyphomonadaceae bacterium]|tara:strand:+ start:2198 stop:3067 length:870 start_codon:yes stop_codon:yes gene_type:complete